MGFGQCQDSSWGFMTMTNQWAMGFVVDPVLMKISEIR